MGFEPRGGRGGRGGGFRGGRGGDRGGFGGEGRGGRGGRGGFGGDSRGGRGGGRGGFGGEGRGGRGFGFGGRGGGRGAPRGRGRGGIEKRGRGGDRGGRGGGKVFVEPHRIPGIFVAKRSGMDELFTKSISPGFSVYNEKRVTAESEVKQEDGSSAIEKVEYRVWNPFRSKLGASVICGIDDTFIKPGDTVLYLGAASGTTVSHVADIVGEKGLVIAVEFANRPGVDLVNMAAKRNRVIPIVHDARMPLQYRFFIPKMVDCIFADVAQPDQVQIVARNAREFLKLGGACVITIKSSCIDSTASPEAVFADQVEVMRQHGIKPLEQLNLQNFQRGHAMIVGILKDLKQTAEVTEV